MIQNLESKKKVSFQDLIQQNITQNAQWLDFQDLYNFKGSFEQFQLEQIMQLVLQFQGSALTQNIFISDEQAFTIYHSLDYVPKKRKLSDQEQDLLKWLLIRLYATKPFQMDHIVILSVRRPLLSLKRMQQSIQKYNVNRFPWTQDEDQFLFNIVRAISLKVRKCQVQSNGKTQVRSSDNIQILNISDNQDNVERDGVTI
ncbi:hypothetical protein pb186bvf_000879 [Paramecium bursaria]